MNFGKKSLDSSFVATTLLILVMPLCAGQHAFAQPRKGKVKQIAKPDLSNAPTEFRSQLAAIEKEIRDNGGFAVAGQVEDEKGILPKPGQFTVALKYNESNAKGTSKFNDGWFITRTMRKEQTEWHILVVASFFHLPIEEPLAIGRARVTWAKATLRRAPIEETTSITGIVTNEDGKPVADALVQLIINRNNTTFGQVTRTETTDAQGKYSFTGITFQPYSIHVSKTGYIYSWAQLATETARPRRPNVLIMKTPWAKGGERTSDASHADFILAYPKAITIDYEYHALNKFTGENVTKGVIWDVTKGIVFSEGVSLRGYRDLELNSQEGELFFRHFFVRQSGHGHYDLGEVPFDSVKEIEEAKAIVRHDTPCVLNHVYGVRTFDGKYAKFVVRKIEKIDAVRYR